LRPWRPRSSARTPKAPPGSDPQLILRTCRFHQPATLQHLRPDLSVPVSERSPTSLRTVTRSRQPLSWTTTVPTVMIGGAPSTDVSFYGLAPGYVGLYQVNALVPAASSNGNAVPVYNLHRRRDLEHRHHRRSIETLGPALSPANHSAPWVRCDPGTDLRYLRICCLRTDWS